MVCKKPFYSDEPFKTSTPVMSKIFMKSNGTQTEDHAIGKGLVNTDLL